MFQLPPESAHPKVLVACPTYSGCAYSLREWADAYKAFTYENRGALFVDNSDDNLHYMHLCRAQGIPTIHQNKRFTFLWDTLEIGWRTIVEYAHDNDYDLILSLEADIIAPPETIDVLVNSYLERGPRALVAHRYHPRGIDNPQVPEGMHVDPVAYAQVRKESWFDTLGCVLFPTKLMYDTRDMWMAIIEVELYLLGKNFGYERVRLKDMLDLRHLEDPDRYALETSTGPNNPNTDRMSPAELEVHAATAPRQVVLTPTQGDEATGWHGRRDNGEVARYGMKMRALEEAKHLELAAEAAAANAQTQAQPCEQAKQLEIASQDNETMIQENHRLRLMNNQLFGEVQRLRGDQWHAPAEVGPDPPFDMPTQPEEPKGRVVRAVAYSPGDPNG